MSCKTNARQNHNIKLATCNKLLENVAKFEHFAAAVTNLKDVQEYVKN